LENPFNKGNKILYLRDSIMDNVSSSSGTAGYKNVDVKPYERVSL